MAQFNKTNVTTCGRWFNILSLYIKPHHTVLVRSQHLTIHHVTPCQGAKIVANCVAISGNTGVWQQAGTISKISNSGQKVSKPDMDETDG